MSDDALYGANDRDFHSPFDLGFDPVAMETIKWLLIGHLLFLIGLAVVTFAGIERGTVWITPLFVLPLLWYARNHRDWALIGVTVVGFTAVHYLAVDLTMRSYQPDAALLPGLIGGAVGGAGSLLLCAVFRLLRPGMPTIVFALFGAAFLAIVGSLGVYMFLTFGSRGSSADELVRMLWIYIPWQLAFAYVLSKVLRPVGDLS